MLTPIEAYLLRVLLPAMLREARVEWAYQFSLMARRASVIALRDESRQFLREFCELLERAERREGA